MVTGGASGLGRAVALGAAQRGAKVVVADIDRAGAEAVAERAVYTEFKFARLRGFGVCRQWIVVFFSTS